jgi:hypothetical protein
MRRSATFHWISLPAALAALSVVLLSAPPALAGVAPGGAAVAPQAAQPLLPACGASLVAFDTVPGVSPLAALRAASPAAVCPLAPAASTPATGNRSRPFRGYCACSCSFVRDCNTSADCGGAACLPGITCC